MRLNEDCIRAVLLEVEDKMGVTGMLTNEEIVIKGYSKEDIDYSIFL